MSADSGFLLMSRGSVGEFGDTQIGAPYKGKARHGENRHFQALAVQLWLCFKKYVPLLSVLFVLLSEFVVLTVWFT